MRFVSFGSSGNERPGVLVDSSVLPLSRVMADIGVAPTGTVRNLLPFLDRVGEGIAAALDRGDEVIPVAQTRLGPPITDPPNLFDCGANYLSHLAEVGAEATPTLPVIFQKPRSALAGPTDAIVRPRECAQLDYEAELAIVIGKAGRRIPADRAGRHIAGYMITTGTPGGVVAGMAAPKWLGPGDTVRIEMTGLGQMRTPALDEQDTAAGAKG